MATQKLFLSLFLTSFAVASAASDGWTDVFSRSDSEEYLAKTGSFEVTTTKGGDEVASVIGRVKSIKDKTITVEKWYVKTDDCAKGYGKLVTLSVSGEYKYDNSFAENDGSVGSTIAELICGVHKRIKEDEEKMGI